ncbi:TonB-dependent receptor plug domain protein [Ostertagia ostertagi]
MLSKQVTTGIMERLPAAANGILVDQTTNDTPQLMVRGLSTLQGPKNPLIILDDFPYEGNLNNINPDMVASVTVLKDAAASSIWGARAANGVIVITTKKGKFDQPLTVEFTANTTMSDKPDLSYLRQMSSSDFIDVEQELFARGFYNSDISSVSHPVLTPVVDLLNRARKGLISQEEAGRQIAVLRQTDVRDHYSFFLLSCSDFLDEKSNSSLATPETLEDNQALLDRGSVRSQAPASAEVSSGDMAITGSFTPGRLTDLPIGGVTERSRTHTGTVIVVHRRSAVTVALAAVK